MVSLLYTVILKSLWNIQGSYTSGNFQEFLLLFQGQEIVSEFRDVSRKNLQKM